jgi:hypothetical protein
VPDFAWPATKQARCSKGSLEVTNRDYNIYKQIEDGSRLRRGARAFCSQFAAFCRERLNPEFALNKSH